jgi:DNA-binding transcriptional ArsR family regulator
VAEIQPPPQPAVIELLGLLAYAELVAFDRMAADARLAPDLTRRAILSEMAGREIDNYCRLADRIRELGTDPEQAMQAFVRPLQEYHEQTEPNDWLEALTKAYIGEGMADDFYRAIAGFLESPDRELVLDVLHESRFEEFSAQEIRAAIAADPKVANRLSMWARRLSGEALSQAQRVAMEHTDLVALVMVGAGDQAASLFKRLTSAHSARMTSVGLNN